MPNEEQPRRLVPKREPTPLLGPIKLDYRAFFGLLTIVFCFVAGGLAIYAAHQDIAAAGIVVCAFALYVFIFWMKPFDALTTTPAAKVHRDARHTFVGSKPYLSDEARQGEHFGELTKKEKEKPPKPIKGIGKIRYIAHHTDGSAPLGVARDYVYGTRSCKLWVVGSSIHAADAETQENILSSFATVLDDIAPGDSLGYRLVWQNQTFMGEQIYPEAILAEMREAAGLDRSAPNEHILLKELGELGKQSRTDRTTITLTIYSGQVRKESRAAGSTEEVLLRYALDFYDRLMGTRGGRSPLGLKAGGIMSYNDLILENRLQLDPVYGQWLWERWLGLDSETDLLSEHAAWPNYVDFKPDSWCRVGQTYHKGFYLSELARGGMSPDQFWDLLSVPIPKTITAVFNMIPQSFARRKAELATASTQGRIAERKEARRVVTELQEVSKDEARRHEGEIARNVGQVGDVRVYGDIHGKDLERVEANFALARAACGKARFRMEPLDGMQERGIEVLTSTGRGLADINPPKFLWF